MMWNDTTKTRPKDSRIVLGAFGIHMSLCCYDDDANWHSEFKQTHPDFWMYIPELPQSEPKHCAELGYFWQKV
jgi:hypothetical protein